MTEYQNKVMNPAAPWSFIDDTEENILHDLAHYTLDPIFELYGDFVDPAPEWLDDAAAEKYAGCTSIFGNFLTYSHAFRLVTDDPGLIARLTAAIDRNRATPEYQAAREKALAKVPTLHKSNAEIGKKYMVCGCITKITEIYRLTEQQAHETGLLYLDRYRGRNRYGTTGAALPGSDMATGATTYSQLSMLGI